LVETTRLRAIPVGITGSATGAVTSSNVVDGRIIAVHVAIEDGGTASFTLAMQREASTENILSLTGITESNFYYPMRQACNNVGSLLYNVTGPQMERYVVADHLSMNITDATIDKTCTMSIYTER
jgi:hypothetical protein